MLGINGARSALRIFSLALFFCLLWGGTLWPQAAAKKTPEAPPTTPTAAEQESQFLDQAFQSAAGNPGTLIKSLEDFLVRFPQSARREQVLRLIFRQALQSNDPQKAEATAERLLEISPDDPSLLSTAADLLDRQGNTASREKAMEYATRFLNRIEKMATEPKPSDVSLDKWRQTQTFLRATGFLLRGRVKANLGQTDEALADYEKSFAAYPSASVAERMGDVCATRGDTERALNYYATAFAFPEKGMEPAHLSQVRKKLSSTYLLKHPSEQGLGDLILARYDELARDMQSRSTKPDTANADVRDPFAFLLQRPDGSEVRLADYRGKVVVMDFWATWCGPCRIEGKMLHQLMETFKSEPSVAFLTVNDGEDRDTVSSFMKDENWTIPTVLAQNLDSLLEIRALPTLVIFDRHGRVVFRQEGIDPESFSDTVQKAVRQALQPPVAPASPAS